MRGICANSELWEPILMLAAARPDGWISASELAARLNEMFERGCAGAKSPGEPTNDIVDILGTIISPAGGQDNIIRIGFAERIEDGIKITELGREYLKEMP
jgi:hypothetical protein